MVNQYFYIKDVVKTNELNSVSLSKKHSNFEGNMADTKLNTCLLTRVNKKKVRDHPTFELWAGALDNVCSCSHKTDKL